MKHSVKITVILLAMFLISQIIGLGVIYSYSPKTTSVTSNGTVLNQTNYNLPYGLEPPNGMEKQSPFSLFIQLVISFVIVIVLYLVLMKFGLVPVMRGWFFIVVSVALGVSINAVLKYGVPYSALVSLAIGIGFSFFKTFRRNIFFHNITELLIYPGICVIFVSLITSYTSFPILLITMILIGISIYDIYAVWHAGFMQKMAKFQINKVKVFSGFFVPYIKKEDRLLMLKAKERGKKLKKVKATLAILGGGDVVWPMMMVGIVFLQFGLISSLAIIAGATVALAGLFYASKKGKFYPAMPFISSGCFIALGIVYLIQYL